MERRDFIRQGALAAGVAWAAPMVRTSKAFAAEGTPLCDASSYDARAEFAGVVSGDAGPTRAFPKDGNDCYANLALTAPGTTHPFLTSDTVCVGGSQTQQDCSAFCELENATLDLTNVDSLLDVQLTASLLRSEATSDCDSDAASGSTTILSAQLCVAGVCQTLQSSPPPNTTVSVNESIDANTQVEVTVILNEQKDIPDGIAVNAVHVFASVLVLGQLHQEADVILCHAQAACPV